ncbi:MAG: hypothetical protein WD469_01805 [Paenibacillaceae bacterium]
MNIENFNKLTQPDIDSITEEYYVRNGSGDILFAPLSNKETVIIKTKDILFLQGEKDIVFIRTLHENYSCKFQSYDVFEMLKRNYSDFRFVDNNLMANILNIVAYDSYLNKIYFTADISIITVSPFMKYLKNSLSDISDLTIKETNERRCNVIPLNGI